MLLQSEADSDLTVMPADASLSLELSAGITLPNMVLL